MSVACAELIPATIAANCRAVVNEACAVALPCAAAASRIDVEISPATDANPDIDPAKRAAATVPASCPVTDPSPADCAAMVMALVSAATADDDPEKPPPSLMEFNRFAAVEDDPVSDPPKRMDVVRFPIALLDASMAAASLNCVVRLAVADPDPDTNEEKRIDVVS